MANALYWAARKNNVDAVKAVAQQIKQIAEKISADQLAAGLSERATYGLFAVGPSGFDSLMNALECGVATFNDNIVKAVDDLIAEILSKSLNHSMSNSMAVRWHELLIKKKAELKTSIIKYLEKIENPDEIARITAANTTLGKLIDHHESITFNNGPTGMRKAAQEIINSKKRLIRKTAQDAALKFMNNEKRMTQENIDQLTSGLIKARENGYDISKDTAYNFDLLDGTIKSVKDRLNSHIVVASKIDTQATNEADYWKAQAEQLERRVKELNGSIDQLKGRLQKTQQQENAKVQSEPVFLGTIVDDGLVE
jgi:hypothetical protein